MCIFPHTQPQAQPAKMDWWLWDKDDNNETRMIIMGGFGTRMAQKDDCNHTQNVQSVT